MKIGFVSSVGAPENTPLAESIKNVDTLVRKQVDAAKARDMEIVFQMSKSFTGIAPGQYGYLKLLDEAETLHSFMEMAKTGEYDAVVDWCFLDPVKREARQALDIPVIGIAETAMHMACMMGAKFGVVAPNDEGRRTTDEYIRALGLQERAVPTRVISLENEWAALEDAHEGIEAMKQVSRELIADGAEVIIPGCVLVDVMAAVVPGCEKEYPNGLTEIDGVPVVNVGAYAVKMAEMLADMRNAGIPWISRKGYYNSAKDNAFVMEHAVPLLEYRGSGFWLD